MTQAVSADPDETGVCTTCGAVATVKFTEGPMAYIHGSWKWLCERCYLDVQIDHALTAAERLPMLMKKLAGLTP